jgi:hypothetical protein
VRARGVLGVLAAAAAAISSLVAAHPLSARTVPIAPLTGMADRTGASLHRSAVTIKIDNTPPAHPQTGIDQADVVYEEVVEGQITRLAAIYNSHVPPVVGPVRSVRRTDASIVWPIGGVFAYSGGAQYAIQTIKTAPVVLVDQFNANGAMFRSSTRVPPHNLYAVPARLFTRGGRPVPPQALFQYRTPYQHFQGRQVGLFTVGFEAGYAVRYHWDGHTLSWDRDIFGAPDYETNHVRLSPRNVVVMWVRYQGGVGTIGAKAVLIGHGRAWIFENGRVIAGEWSHAHPQRPITYHDGAGRTIHLNTGQTWVELLNVADGVFWR